MDKYTKPDFTKCVVLTIDTQNDFTLPGAIAEIKGTNDVIPRITNILEVGRRYQIPYPPI